MRPPLLSLLPCVIFAALAVLAGCRQRPLEERRPAPSSAMTRELSLLLARRVAMETGGVVFSFTPTGSMLPVLDSRAVGVAEQLGPGDRLHAGDIVGFRRGADIVCHRVLEVAADGSAFLSGDNTRADGWVARPLIRYRLFAIFYSRRADAAAPSSLPASASS